MALALPQTQGQIFGPSGPNHAPGLVPDPGSTQGTINFLREDATFDLITTSSLSPQGNAGQVLTSNGTGASPSFQAAAITTFIPPNVTVLTSGSGTYTTPTGGTAMSSPLYLEIRMVGGGGGGNDEAQGGAGGSGTLTSFGPTSVNPGGGNSSNSAMGGIGGSGGSGPVLFRVAGGYGQSTQVVNGGNGGVSPFGGAGGGGFDAIAATAAAANSGSGGGGGSSTSGSTNGGGGGGAGEYAEVVITSPEASYSYIVGTGGTGTGNGANGASGIIVVKAHYQ